LIALKLREQSTQLLTSNLYALKRSRCLRGVIELSGIEGCGAVYA
jgi:hypothetical protein